MACTLLRPLSLWSGKFERKKLERMCLLFTHTVTETVQVFVRQTVQQTVTEVARLNRVNKLQR